MEFQKTQQKKFSSEQKAVCFVVLVITFVSAVFGSAMNLLVPTMGKEFNVSASLVGLILTSFSVTVAVLSIPFGRLADIIGKRRVFVPGILIFSAFSLMPVLAQNFVVLIIFRFLQAIGGAMAFSTTTAILASVFPDGERGKAVGLLAASMYVGLTVGPIGAGIMNDYFGWRSIFLVTCALSAIAFIAAVTKLPKDGKNLQGISINMFKDIVYIFKLFTGNLIYASLNIVVLLASGVGFVIVYLMSLYVQVVLGYSSQTTGLILVAQPVLMTALSLYAGKLSDKISPFKLVALGLTICTVGVGIGVFINDAFPLWLVICALAISGIGFGLFAPPSTVAIMSCVENKDYGTASAVLVTMRFLGYSASIAIVSLIASIHMGSIPLAEAEIDVLVTTMRASFTLFLVVCSLGVFIAIKCGKHAKMQKNN